MTNLSLAELRQRILDGHTVNPEELDAARRREAAEGEIAGLEQQRSESLERQERSTRAVVASLPIKERAAKLAARDEINAALSSLETAVRQFFDAGASYNAQVEELRRDAGPVAAIEPTAPTGITLDSDRFIVDGHALDTFDAGEQAFFHYAQEAVNKAKAPTEGR